MCDYSLQFVANRPAKVGDKLVSSQFVNSFTRGCRTMWCNDLHQLDAKIEGFLTVMIRGSTSPTIKEVHE